MPHDPYEAAQKNIMRLFFKSSLNTTMKLILFSEKTMPVMKGRTGLPRISFEKNGLISLNKHAVELMGLMIADKLSIAQDEDNPGDWYIFKDSEEGFTLRGDNF